MEWLANLSVKWVLVAIGGLLLARMLALRAHRRRELWVTASEFIEAALAAIVVVFLVIRPHFLQAYFIPSESMRPTLMESDRILVNKLVYHFGDPRRGEIVVFRPPEGRFREQKDYIKRVIGLPGDLVEVVPERLLVDGKTVMRFTREAASDIRSESFRPDVPIGFTFPLENGTVRVDGAIAHLSSGRLEAVQVATYGPRDVVRESGTFVYLNGHALLSAVFGPIETSHNLTQWGGDPSLEGRVFGTNGEPRLVLVRGSRLSLDDGHVMVNGHRLHEPYVAEPPAYPMPPVRLRPGEYFMMGDNRNRSEDSHVWGPLRRSRIIGRAEFVFWPPGRGRWLSAH